MFICNLHFNCINIQQYNILSLEHIKLQKQTFMHNSSRLNNLSITVDITPLRGEKTGIGNYVQYTLKFLLSHYEDLNINAISFGFHKFQNNSQEIVQSLNRHTHIPIPTRVLYKWWQYFNYPRIDNLINDNSILHFTNYYLPPLRNRKTVLTIYDLSFLTNPQWVNAKIINLFQPTILNSAQRATHIITCSEKSKKDIETLLGIPEEKISVAYPGFDENIFYPISKQEAQQHIEKHYRISPPFILFVGTIEERNNIIGLLKIYEKIYQQIPHKLVLVGKKGFGAEDIFVEMRNMKCADKIIYLNYIQNHADLRWFYNSADLFIFPSFDEGFGIPPLEAMACGCPVIVSNQGALPEVVGSKGIAIHPRDVDCFVETTLKILSDIQILNEIRQNCTLQARNFSWAKTAQTHYEVYKKLEEI